MKDSDLPLSDAAGNGAKIAKIPRIPMHTPATTGSKGQRRRLGEMLGGEMRHGAGMRAHE